MIGRATARLPTKTADGRDAWLVPSDDAGMFRAEIIERDPWSALEHAGLITRTEANAAARHAEIWAATDWVAKGRSGFEPIISHGRTDIADRLGEDGMRAWRLFRRAQAAVPAFARGVVYATAVEGRMPAEKDASTLRVGLRALAKVYGISSR